MSLSSSTASKRPRARSRKVLSGQPATSSAGLFVLFLAAVVFLTGVMANPLSATAHDVASALFP